MNIKRLEKLAAFLDKLPPKKWNFRVFVDGDHEPGLQKGCDTKACAVGWCPVVFPRSWRYNENWSIEPRLRKDSTHSSIDDAAMFFRLSEDDAIDLFAERSSRKTTSKKMAKEIRKFIAAGGK